MPFINDKHLNANLGWLFYKDYFLGTLPRDEKNDANNEGKDTLQNRNYTITQRKFESRQCSFDVGATHGYLLRTTYPGLLIGSGYTHEYDKEKVDKNVAFKIGFFFRLCYRFALFTWPWN